MLERTVQEEEVKVDWKGNEQPVSFSSSTPRQSSPAAHTSLLFNSS